MNLYLARHGATDWNSENRVLGRTDIPLNELGIKQAEQLAERLEVISLDTIYTSPLSRAVLTGEIIAKRQACICMTEERLIEQDFGIFEGVDRSDPVYQAAKRKYFCRYPGGESYFDLVARVYPFLFRIREESAENQNVLIVSHGGVCRVIANYFIEMDNEEFASFTMKNCEVRKFVL